MRKIFVLIAALAVALLGMFITAPAHAASGDSASDPIVVASPSEVPDDAVEDNPSTYVDPNSECANTRSWVQTVHHPAETHTVVVVDKEEVPEIWANFSPDHQEGPFTGPPSWPTDERGTWHLHDKIPGGHEGPDGVYQRDNPGQGNGDWFFRQNHQDAVTHEETVIDKEAYDVVTYYAWTDGADCPVTLPGVATAKVTVKAPDCDSDGSANYSASHAYIIGRELNVDVGKHQAVFKAFDGYEFPAGPGVTTNENGSFKTVTYTVKAATGDCPVTTPHPPKHHTPVPPKHTPAPPVKHTTPALPNAGMTDSKPNYLLGLALGLITLGGGLLFVRKRA